MQGVLREIGVKRICNIERMNGRLRLLAGLVLLVGLSTGCASGRAISTVRADALQQPGLPNLHRVDERVFRGAQPSSEGIEALRELGIKTVINLRLTEEHRADVDRCGLDYEHVPSIPIVMGDETVVQFLRVASDPARQPVFIHCRRGADRTGLMTAAYRVVVLGWSKESALREMRTGGFGYDPIFSAALSTYVREMDVEDLRKRL